MSSSYKILNNLRVGDANNEIGLVNSLKNKLNTNEKHKSRKQETFKRKHLNDVFHGCKRKIYQIYHPLSSLSNNCLSVTSENFNRTPIYINALNNEKYNGNSFVVTSKEMNEFFSITGGCKSKFHLTSTLFVCKKCHRDLCNYN